MSQEAKWVKFLRRITSGNEAYTRVSLVQVMSTGAVNTLRNFDLNSSFGYDQARLEETVAELFVTAQEDAEGHRGISSYALRAIKGVTVGERSATIRLRNQEAEFEDDLLGESEQANVAGVTAQQMRHNEALLRALVQSLEINSQQSTAIIARQATQIEHYDKQHWQNVLEREDLLSQRDEREMARLDQASRQRRFDETLKMLKPLVPAALSKLKGLPPAAKAEAQKGVLTAIMQDISPEQMEQIANVLGDKALGLVELYLDAKKQSEPEEFPTEPAKH